MFIRTVSEMKDDVKIERKAMIRNQYCYLTPLVPRPQRIESTKSTAPQSKHIKQKAKRIVSLPKIGQTAIQNKKKSLGYTCKDLHSKNIKPQKKHCWNGQTIHLLQS